MKVAVIMSTYNGEKYLKEQIESIMNQTYKNFDLIIRDDCSSDSTVSIIKQFMEDYKNIKLLNGEKNLGFIKSFYTLLQENNDYDYYSYADQDDYWENTKIEKIVKELDKLDNNLPNMGFCYSDYYDDDLKFLNVGSRNKMNSFRNSLVECISQGMTMIINKKARDIIVEKKSENSLYHDQWTYMICSGLGNVVCVEEPLVRYRRLSNNVTAEGKGIIAVLKWRIKKLIFGGGFKKFKYQILDFKELFYNDLNQEQKKCLDLFSQKYNLCNAIKKTFSAKRFRSKIIDEIFVRICFLFGII